MLKVIESCAILKMFMNESEKLCIVKKGRDILISSLRVKSK